MDGDTTMVQVGRHRLETTVFGSGEPAVVVEPSLGGYAAAWRNIATTIAQDTTVVTYNRAPYGASSPARDSRRPREIADDLHGVLKALGVTGPLVLVGHSIGGIYLRTYAALHMDQIAGMVLVDPVAPAEWNPPSEHDWKLTRIGAKVCRRAALLSRIGIIRFVAFLLTSGVKKPAGYLVRLISRGTPADAGSVSSPWFSALPANEKGMASVFWVQQKFALTIASQLENLPASAARVGELDNFCDKPVVILSAGTAPEHRRKEHAAMARRLPLGDHVLAGRSDHWIMQEEPDLVIRAIEKVVKHARNSQVASVATQREEEIPYKSETRKIGKAVP